MRRVGPLLGVLLVAPAVPAAEPYRLRADAFAMSSPVGLAMVSARDRELSWLDAEAVVWTGANTRRTESADGDAVIASVRVHDPRGAGEARFGRMVYTTGAIRPLHIDGVSGRARLPGGVAVEAFGGMPVTPRFEGRGYRYTWDWATGGRLSWSREGAATVGASYVQERARGLRANEEVGGDFALVPLEWLDFAGRGAWDLVYPGLAEARVAATARSGGLRLAAHGTRRSPSRLLPATSLFSALGDVPSDEVGLSAQWRVAPRLELVPTGAARWVGGDPGWAGSLRAVLRLDDRGEGALSVEGKRQTAPAASWSGARAGLRVPVVRRVTAAMELEIAVPDDTRRGRAWPWGLVALGYRPAPKWEAAAAVEAGASPSYLSQVTGLVRVSREWGGP